jgi:hypothetical protein
MSIPKLLSREEAVSSLERMVTRYRRHYPGQVNKVQVAPGRLALPPVGILWKNGEKEKR